MRGPEGPPGPTGTTPVIDYDQIAVEVINRLPPITVTTIMDDGTEVESVDVRLGQTLKLKHSFTSRQINAERTTIRQD